MTDSYGSVQSVVSLAAERIADKLAEVASQYALPSVVYRPRLFLDGNKWCALYGANLHEGCAGFGDSPAEAMHDFNCNWEARLAAGEAQIGGGRPDVAI